MLLGYRTAKQEVKLKDRTPNLWPTDLIHKAVEPFEETEDCQLGSCTRRMQLDILGVKPTAHRTTEAG